LDKSAELHEHPGLRVAEPPGKKYESKLFAQEKSSLEGELGMLELEGELEIDVQQILSTEPEQVKSVHCVQ